VQLIAVGVIGEYIARLSANVRQRPLYIIAESDEGPQAAVNHSVS
jgi:dolichol-phosphate mannosyltransferase